MKSQQIAEGGGGLEGESWTVGGRNEPKPHQDHIIIINEMELHLYYRLYATAAAGNGGGGAVEE